MINIFEAELEKGTGIPYLLIKNKVIEVSPEVDSILLNNILKCTAYDPQCEGLRAEYMFSILSNYQNKEKIYKEVFQAFNIMTDTDWDEQQIFEFVCKIINEKKDDKKILYNKIRYYIENGKDDLYTMYSFVEKEGLRAIEFMARECGKYVEKHPNYEFYYYDGFFQDFDNKNEVISFLKRSEDKYIKLYMQTIKDSKPFSRSKPKTAEELIGNYFEKGNFYPLHIWLRNSDISEIQKISQYILKCEKKKLKYRLLSFFDEVKIPVDYEILKKEYHKVRKLDYKIKILRAMLLFDEKEVQELIYDLDFNNSDVIELYIKSLCIFYSEDIDGFLLEKIDSLNSYSCHNIFEFLINNKNLIEHRRLYKTIVYKLYHKNKCSLCRNHIFDKMVENDILNKTICEECMYDCNEDIVHKACKIYNTKYI